MALVRRCDFTPSQKEQFAGSTVTLGFQGVGNNLLGSARIRWGSFRPFPEGRTDLHAKAPAQIVGSAEPPHTCPGKREQEGPDPDPPFIRGLFLSPGMGVGCTGASSCPSSAPTSANREHRERGLKGRTQQNTVSLIPEVSVCLCRYRKGGICCLMWGTCSEMLKLKYRDPA